MSDELSLKFLINQADHARLLRHPLLRGASAKRQPQVVSIHYDTRALQLQKHGVELTLRRNGGSWLQCVQHHKAGLKAGQSSADWSVPYFNHFDFAEVGDPKLRDWLSQEKISTRITPIFESDIRSTTWRISSSSGAAIDASMCRGSMVSSGRRAPVSDLELYLVKGTRTDLYLVAIQLATRISLMRQLHTQSERGRKLFLDTRDAATKADGLNFSPKAPPLQAFQQIAFNCLRQLQANQPGAIASDDPEYIHQMRVATRRLRAAIQVFKPLIVAEVVTQMTVPLRDLMQVLGRVRDLDVVISEIVNPVAKEMPDDPSVAALSATLTERRYRALEEVCQRLQKPEFGQMQLQTEALLYGPAFDTSRQLPSAQPDVAIDGEVPAVALTEFAQKRLRNLLNKMQDAANRTRIDDPASLHRLRICIKRLRYALEFFRPMMAKKAATNALQILVNAQEKLGKLNDITVAGEVLMLCIASDRSLRLAVSVVASSHAQRYADLLANVELDIKQINQLTLPRLD